MLDLRIGADVHGRDGKLGEISRIIVTPVGDAISGIAVRRGLLTPAEYVVPLGALRPAPEGGVAIEMDEHEIEQCQRLDMGLYREPDPDYSGPPGWDRRALGMANLQFTSVWAMGPMAGLGQAAPVMGFPGGEPSRPLALRWSSLRSGSDVLDAAGEKVGEVAEVTVDPVSGRPDHIAVRRGWLFKSEMEVPAEWVSDIRDDAIVLDGERGEIEHRLAS